MNTGKQEKSGSLTRELAAIIVGLVAVIIVICWFLNTTFLGKYYTEKLAKYYKKQYSFTS